MEESVSHGTLGGLMDVATRAHDTLRCEAMRDECCIVTSLFSNVLFRFSVFFLLLLDGFICWVAVNLTGRPNDFLIRCDFLYLNCIGNKLTEFIRYYVTHNYYNIQLHNIIHKTSSIEHRLRTNKIQKYY